MSSIEGPMLLKLTRRVLAGGLLALALPCPAALADPAPKREFPDYDGRGRPSTTPGDVALWVPRILLSPIYLTTEYVIRRPLGAAISWAERARLPQFLYNFFFFGPDHKAGFAPLAFVDFGFNPSVGIYAFWEDAFFQGNDLRFHGSVWNNEWLAGALTERVRFRGRDSVSLNVLGVRRPDLVFYGLGPRSLKSDQSRYGEQKLEGSGMFDVPFWQGSRVQATIGVRSVDLYHGHFDNDPSIEQQAAGGGHPLPPGFGAGYTAEYNHLLVAIDNRPARPAPGSGVRLELEGEQGNDVRAFPANGWLRYGGTAGGFYDLDGYGRVVSVSVATMFADPLGKEAIPFTELVSLGGSGPMRGFYPGRLVDRSAGVATLHYRWPIWVWLDGSLQASVGNVFGEHLRELKPSLLRFSGAIGIESVGSPDNSLELLVGLGSETFEHGGQIDSVRVAIGTNRGF